MAWQIEHHSRRNACQRALQEIHDDTELKRIAYEHPVLILRREAIEAMTNEADLIEFVRSDDSWVREAALRASRDQGEALRFET